MISANSFWSEVLRGGLSGYILLALLLASGLWAALILMWCGILRWCP